MLFNPRDIINLGFSIKILDRIKPNSRTKNLSFILKTKNTNYTQLKQFIINKSEFRKKGI